jgi:hypothetical protein
MGYTLEAMFGFWGSGFGSRDWAIYTFAF